MFPGDISSGQVSPQFDEEYQTVLGMPFYDVVLFDLERAINDRKLILNRMPTYPKAPAMYRGPRLVPADYKNLVAAAESAGLRMTTDHWRYERLHRYEFYGYRVLGETHEDFPRSACITHDTRKTALGHVAKYLIRNRSDGMFSMDEVSDGARVDRVIKNLDESPRLIGFLGSYTDEMLEDLKEKHLKGHDFIQSNLLMQAWLPLKHYGESTNEWRGRFFDGQLFELLPNSNQPEDAPRPPQWIIDKHLDESPYFEMDFAEVEDGDWQIIGTDDGQVAGRTLGQTAEEYYASLEKVARESPHLPE